jgi:hypothetical protein
MSKTAPTRLPSDLFEVAGAVADVMSRSAAQQIAHWARVGREVELSASISVESIRGVLSGRRSYDELSGEEQAVVRARWAERMDALRADLDYSKVFAQTGRSYVELDDDGNVVRRGPDAAPVQR